MKKTSHQCSEASLEALQPAFPKDRRHEQGQEKEGQQEEEEVQGSAPIFHPQNLGFADQKLRTKIRANQTVQVAWSEWQKKIKRQIQVQYTNSIPNYPHDFPEYLFLTILHVPIFLCLQETMAGKVHLRHSS